MFDMNKMLNIPSNPPSPGMMLISGANLTDPNFSRSVVFLCDHKEEGSFGLILNQPLPLKISDVVDDIFGWDARLYRGGPVQESTLHFLHRCPDLDIGSLEVIPGIYWGGDFEKLNSKLSTKRYSELDVRFFVGYSGWGEGQLLSEIQRDSWYLRKAISELVFYDDSRNHWRNIFKTMGREFKILTHFPDDPRYN